MPLPLPPLPPTPQWLAPPPPTGAPAMSCSAPPPPDWVSVAVTHASPPPLTQALPGEKPVLETSTSPTLPRSSVARRPPRFDVWNPRIPVGPLSGVVVLASGDVVTGPPSAEVSVVVTVQALPAKRVARTAPSNDAATVMERVDAISKVLW